MKKYLIIWWKGHDIGRHILNIGVVPRARDSKDARRRARERFGKPPEDCEVSCMQMARFNHYWRFL